MADNLNYSGNIDIRDPELFTAETDLLNMNLYSRKGGTRKLITGQNVADGAIENGDIEALTAETTPATDDVLLIRDISAGTNKKITVANLAGTAISTYSLVSNRLHITGTAGITAAIASGELTITIPSGGVLCGGSFDFTTADAVYSNGVLITDAIKVTFDNSANSTTVLRAFFPQVLAKTGASIDGTTPAQNNSALVFNGGTDEHASGITSFYIKDVPSNAPSGGILCF